MNLNEKVIDDKFYGAPEDPATFGSKRNLKNSLISNNIKDKEIENYLQHQYVHTLHKSVQRHFGRNSYIVFSSFEMFEIDIMDIQNLKEKNDNFRYILCCIDVFSKKAYMEPIKTKGGLDVSKAFKRILDRAEKLPKSVNSDRGKEFLNKNFRILLSNLNIKQMNPTTVSGHKCAFIERFQRTAQSLIYKAMTAAKSQRWIDNLQNIEDKYNNTYHTTIKMSPNEVNDSNTAQVYQNIKNKSAKNRVPYYNYDVNKNSIKNNNIKLHLNDFVRVALPNKSAFSKSYTPNWSPEVYQIYKILQKTPFYIYMIRDLTGTELDHRFYRQQLQKVQLPVTIKIPIKIKKTRGIGNSLQYLLDTLPINEGNTETSPAKWFSYKALKSFKNDQQPID